MYITYQEEFTSAGGGKRKMLFSKDSGREKMTSYRRILDCLKQFDQTDQNKQCDRIRTSMELVSENKENFVNQIYEVKTDDRVAGKEEKESLKKVITILTDCVLM